MSGASIGVALLLLAGGGLGTLALIGGPTGGMMGGGSVANCASMHSAGHAHCSRESGMGSHAFCDPMGMSQAQCREMQSYMGGSGMSGPCH